MLDDDRFDALFRLKLDLFERLRISRIRNRDRNLVASLGERHYALALHQLDVDYLVWQQLQVKRRKIKYRIPEGLRAKACQTSRINASALQKRVNERRFIGGGLFGNGICLRRSQTPRLHKRAR